MAKTREITLTKPLTVTFKAGEAVREEKIAKLVFEVPEDGLKAKHLRATDGHSGTVAMTLALASYFCGQPIKVLDELAEPDFVQVYELIEVFRKPGQTDGATSAGQENSGES